MKASILLLAVCLCCSKIFAQDVPPTFDGAVEDTPVDGGLSLLLAAAVGFGLRRKTKDSQRINFSEDKLA